MASAAEASDGRVPSLAAGWERTAHSLSPAEGFLLSRIDGHTPWGVLREIGGLVPEEAEQLLERWIDEGIVVVGSPEEPAGAPVGQGPPEAGLDESLDISLELQRRILDFETSLDRPYDQLLGVERDADAKTIKRAYFKLSKEFHPDRYFRRNLGGFAVRLEGIFKKVVEAYELLSDPATRAEIERSMMSAPPQEAAPGADPVAGEVPRELTKWDRLARLRRQFKIPEEVLSERKFKARRFYDAAQVAARGERWLEAAASVRLAIAFDPWNRDYKTAFGEIQGRVHQVRAAELLERAAASFDSSAQQEALRLYEEALHYRPLDAEANDRAAQLALELGELERAREYTDTACGLAPETAAYHRTRGRVLRRMGLRDEAREALEEALRLDPDYELASEQLASYGVAVRRSRSEANG